MIRDDISNKLVHLVRGDTVELAFATFQNILSERRLRGGTGYIRDGYRCICFSEAPIGKLGFVLASPNRQGVRYRPFGVMVDKTYVYSQGGRPVIYQGDGEYASLPEALRYRHVRFEIEEGQRPIDFTWEREWRLRADELPLHARSTTVIVPNRHWRDAFVEAHAERMQGQVLVMGADAALAVEPYPWHMIVLEDLGVQVDDGL